MHRGKNEIRNQPRNRVVENTAVFYSQSRLRQVEESLLFFALPLVTFVELCGYFFRLRRKSLCSSDRGQATQFNVSTKARLSTKHVQMVYPQVTPQFYSVRSQKDWNTFAEQTIWFLIRLPNTTLSQIKTWLPLVSK